MRVAVTGTPGVGKTTIAPLLAARLGIRDVRGIREWAHAVGAVVGRDDADDADVIDLDVLDATLPEGDVLVEGHMAHLLDVDRVVVLRLHPDTLRSRMEARGYKAEKVQENLEAEMMDLILQEALDGCDHVTQVDTTGRSPEEVARACAPAGHLTGDMEPVDWTHLL